MAQTMKSGKKKKKHLPVLWSIVILIILIPVVIWMIPESEKKSESFRFYEFSKDGELLFKRNDRTLKKIDIEIADSEYKTVMGLMFRKEMHEDQGMLFLFDREEPRSFWMKDTYISLDILFIDAQKRIVTIHKYTKPFSTQGYASAKPAQYVVEVVAGFTDKYRIKPGDAIEWFRTKREIK